MDFFWEFSEFFTTFHSELTKFLKSYFATENEPMNQFPTREREPNEPLDTIIITINDGGDLDDNYAE